MQVKKSLLTRLLVFLFLSLGFVACADQGGDFLTANMDTAAPLEEWSEMEMKSEEGWAGGSDDAPVSNSAASTAISQTDAPPPSQNLKRKIIYTGNLRIQVESIEETHKRILSMLDEYGAYLSSDQISNSYGWQENTMAIRVPRDKFYDLLNRVEKEAVFVDSKNVSASDVTEEYYDVKTRIDSKKAAEAQYLSILKQARSIAEILEVQTYLNNVREEIERLEGRLKFLDNQTTYSTLTVTFWQNKDMPTAKTPSFWDKLGKGAGYGWDGLKAVLIAIVTLWPLWLLGIGFFFFLRWLIRRSKAKSAAKKNSPPPVK